MKFFPKDKTALNGRVFRSGLYSAAITAAVLVLAVLVNLLVRALPTKYTTFDLSEAGLYTLSDSSAQVAQGLFETGFVRRHLCDEKSFHQRAIDGFIGVCFQPVGKLRPAVQQTAQVMAVCQGCMPIGRESGVRRDVRRVAHGVSSC